MKIVVSVLVLLAIAGIFIYKTASAKTDGSSNTSPKQDAAFAFAQSAPSTAPVAESQPSAVATPDAATPDVAKTGQKIGEDLESLAALNKVALSQDAVFIFVPASSNMLADDKTSAAVLAAERTLITNKIVLGLYTLQTNSPNYSAIAAQVQAPAILVACKGKGMAAVSGEITENKLLQAFTASSRAGGCGPSGCGPSGCGPSGCN